MKQLFSLALLGLGFAHLPATGQAVESRAIFHKQSEAEALAPAALAAGPLLAHYPEQISPALAVPADWVFFRGIGSPHRNEWVYLERSEIGTAFRLWRFDAATGTRRLLFDAASSPAPGLALKPIAWTPADADVVYLEALHFDSDAEHEGVWAYNLRTGRAAQLPVSPRYSSTPQLSPDGTQLLYATMGHTGPRDLLHGAADAVVRYELRTARETVLAAQADAGFAVTGWTAAPGAAAPKAGGAVLLPRAAAGATALAAAVQYYLPWDAGRDYFVSRTGTPAPTGPHTPSGARNPVYDSFNPHTYVAIDFDTPDDRDDLVRAAAAGQVTLAGLTSAGLNGGYGRLVIVTHADGTRTYYGHNSRILVSVGQQVAAGEALSYEGTTGGSSGDHIHFEWRAAGGDASTFGTFANAGQPRASYPYRATTPGTGTPAPSGDTQAPTTSISAPSTTVAADFTATFADADNVGVAERFYQPLEYTGTEWRANRGNGFYNDNFGAGALHSDYTPGLADWQGTWGVTADGRLAQSNATATNTALTTFLSQTSGNTYLYNFAARILGSAGSTTGRFGIHLMASDASVRERGNSYLVWVSADDQKVRIIETINNVLNERASADIGVTPGAWADYKATYNTATGTLQVYVNGRPVLSWTDATPLTAGAYISLRTNTAQVEFDDLKVYKSRAATRLVTVGAANTKDLRRASPNASTPAGKVKSLVRDAAGNWSAVGNLDLVVNLPAARALAALAADPALYPNPVAQGAVLGYELADAAAVTVTVLDGTGTALRTLPQGMQAAGAHRLPFTALDGLRPGTYLVRVQAGAHTSVLRVVKD